MVRIFISDLHLEENRPDIAAIFFHFLKTKALEAEELYILGDFFETWIGDDDLSSFNLRIMQALKTAVEQGLKIYLMHGNRDFLLGKKFLRKTGCVLLPDEYVINLFDVPTLLMHGDTLCTEDVAYLKFRKRTRRFWVQQLFLLRSLKSRQEKAKKYRVASKAHTSTAPEHILDVTPAEIERVMVKHHVQHLIHGHTHREAVHSFSLNGLPATRTVLGAWHEHGSALVCTGHGKQELIVIQ